MTGNVMFDAGLFLILLVVVIVAVDRIMWLRHINKVVDSFKSDNWHRSLDAAKKRGDFRE